jgi:hypothetical protein
MEHAEATRLMATEKYLLDELLPDVREQFEEHLFGCHECAMDVRAGSVFLEQGKSALADSEAPTVNAGIQQRFGRFAWWHPAFAIPVMAMLLIVIGYQNLVTLPRLTKGVNKPQVLPAATLNLHTYGTNASPLVLRAGQGFLLNVIVPPEPRYAAYRADLHSPAGGVESVAIPASAVDTWPIRFSGTNRQSGTYKLIVSGLTASGQDVAVGSSSFQLQIQE